MTVLTSKPLAFVCLLFFLKLVEDYDGEFEINRLSMEKKRNLTKICGVSEGGDAEQQGQFKVVGDAARPKQFPWSIRVYAYQIPTVTEDDQKWCNGVLITQQHILTPAHCLFPDSPDATLYRGFLVLVANSNVANSRKYEIIGIKFQPCYEIKNRYRRVHDRTLKSNVYYDIVIAQLSEPIDQSLIDDHLVLPACLPTSEEAAEENNLMFAAFNGKGWNKTLKWASMKKSKCRHICLDCLEQYYTQTCYKPIDKDFWTEKNDSGGGLVAEDISERWHVIGILLRDAPWTGKWTHPWTTGRSRHYFPVIEIIKWIKLQLGISPKNF